MDILIKKLSYSQKTNCDVVKAENIIEWNNNNGSFWNFVAKLHLLIRTGRYFNDSNSIDSKEKHLIEEIGYGNLNNIKLRQTFQKEGTLPEITSNSDYKELQKTGLLFVKVKTILEAYHPDLIIILSTQAREEMFDDLQLYLLENYDKEHLKKST